VCRSIARTPQLRYALAQTDLGGIDREAEHVEERVGCESEAADAWGPPSGVGEVQEGSLKEALWGWCRHSLCTGDPTR
jgi:hypothetical protein